MRTEELNDLNSALNPEAIDELFAGLGTTKRPSPPQQLTASTDNTPPVRRRRLSSQGPTTRNVATQNSEGIDWVSWFYKLVIVACFAPLAILLLTSYSWSPFRDYPAAQPICKMLTERRVVTGDIAEFDVGMRAMGQNLEIHNQHVYQVTTAGILVHNTCWNDFQRGTRGLFGSRTDAAAAYRNLRTSAYAPYKDPYSKVGHSFTKHAAARRAGTSVFPRLAGNDAAKEATARSI